MQAGAQSLRYILRREHYGIYRSDDAKCSGYCWVTATGARGVIAAHSGICRASFCAAIVRPASIVTDVTAVTVANVLSHGDGRWIEPFRMSISHQVVGAAIMASEHGWKRKLPSYLDTDRYRPCLQEPQAAARAARCIRIIVASIITVCRLGPPVRIICRAKNLV